MNCQQLTYIRQSANACTMGERITLIGRWEFFLFMAFIHKEEEIWKKN